MAFWQRKTTDFDEMETIIDENPGIRATDLADQLGINRSTVQRRLPSMEEAGYLFSEDDKGGLWPFGRRK